MKRIITHALALCIAGSAIAAGPLVTSVSPARNSLSAPSSTDIIIDFDRPIDPSSVNAVTFKVFGHWSGVPQGTTIFEKGNTRIRFTPLRPFNAGEYVMVNLAKAVEDTAGDSMVKGYAWMFWTKPSPGSMELTAIDTLPVREVGEGHIQTYGAYGGDFNGDGYMDLAMPNEITADVRVMLNDGAGAYSNFTIIPLANGSVPSPNEGADFNGDGLLDYGVGNAGNDQFGVLLGNGTGGFSVNTSYQAASGVRGVCVLDLDGDGDWDAVTANRNGSNISIHKNNGDGTFAARVNIDANGGGETACAVADANNDGVLDVFVGSYNTNEIAVMLCDGNGNLTFSDEIPAGGKPWMLAVGDMNGDGNVDVVSANSFSNNVAVAYGDGAGNLGTATTYSIPNFSLAIDVGDIDGDGDLDLVSSNYGSGDWTIFENNGTGGLVSPRTLNASTAGSCATLYDRDNDGDLDMTGIDEIDDLVFIFENPGAAFSYPMDAGWNLLSVPLAVTDPRKTTLFPSAVSEAYRFDGMAGYAVEDSLENGVGYWLKFATAQTVGLAGAPIENDTIQVQAGWNQIGGLALPVATGTIPTIPPGIIDSQFYEFGSGYVAADTLQPSRGYWIKSTTSGQLILNGATPSSLKKAKN